MANRDNPYGFIARHSAVGGNGSFAMWYGLLRSNTVCAAGDALRASSGYLDLDGVASTDAIVGVSQGSQATSVTTNPEILFTPATDHTIFSGQCSGTPTQANIWTTCDIEGTTGIMEVNENATTYNVCNLVGFQPETSIGTNAEVLFIWNKSRFTGKGVA